MTIRRLHLDLRGVRATAVRVRLELAALSPWARRVLAARAKGECVRCGDPWRGSTAECPICLDDRIGSKQEARDANRAKGRCACGDPVTWGEQCGVCRQRGREQQRRTREKLRPVRT